MERSENSCGRSPQFMGRQSQFMTPTASIHCGAMLRSLYKPSKAKQRWGDFVATELSLYYRTASDGCGKAKENDNFYPLNSRGTFPLRLGRRLARDEKRTS